MKHRFTIAIAIATLGPLVFASPAAAQRGMGSKSAPAAHAAFRGSFAMAGRGGLRFAHPARPFSRGGGSWGWIPGWGWGYLPYADFSDDYQPPMPPAPPWESAPLAAQGLQPERDIHPLLIERQGDQWVQVAGYPLASPQAESAPAAPPRASTPGRTEAAARELPPDVLVFRDGHQEEVKSYTIIGDILYVKANYWTTGAWTRKIEINQLDVPATLKLNQERGLNFSLPSGPQEVVIRM
jgi:hypothetical protein